MIDPTGPDLDEAFSPETTLPADLSAADPFDIFQRWFDEACERRLSPNPNAFALATTDAEGRPSCRIVLCRKLSVEHGYIVFYTNKHSRKGHDIAANDRAAATFHWDPFAMQVRIEGRITDSPDDESDEYFSGRGIAKAIAAWSSDQSRPVGSREEMLAKVEATMKRFGVDPDTDVEPEQPIPRPPYWGGYRLHADSIELWLGNDARLHDRAVWKRSLEKTSEGISAGAWTATRLQP